MIEIGEYEDGSIYQINHGRNKINKLDLEHYIILFKNVFPHLTYINLEKEDCQEKKFTIDDYTIIIKHIEECDMKKIIEFISCIYSDCLNNNTYLPTFITLQK